MATSSAPATQTKEKETFVWSDDEAELLLNVTYEYKVKHSANSIDWEKVKSKYADILQLYVEQLPTPEEATTLEKDFPQKTRRNDTEVANRQAEGNSK